MKQAEIAVKYPEMVTPLKVKGRKSVTNATPPRFTVAIEACKSWQVFRRRATEFFTELCALLPETVAAVATLSINGDGSIVPRRGAFEVEIVRQQQQHGEADGGGSSSSSSGGEQEKTLIWSGHKKGPPRKEKFPDPKSLVDDVLQAIN